VAKIGLRIDVDTFRGTRNGIPALCELLKWNAITASFFLSVGPDNMGRNLWRLFRPSFLLKMIRSNAAGLYGWDILLKGTIWPGPQIGKRLSAIIRNVSESGHEIGFHAWDHYAWQNTIENKSANNIQADIQRGIDLIKTITGQPPTCSAAPGWKCTDTVLIAKENFNFSFNSDCRGTKIFLPTINGQQLKQPQIPTTMPTFDEVIGRNGITTKNYNEYMLSQIHPDKLNVITIHAEVEGILTCDMFSEFIQKAQKLGHKFVPLGSLLLDYPIIGTGIINHQIIDGREGWIAMACHDKQPNTKP
jgi:undecaprenyl phosphate-alpha-L-ara4FN deformylase